MVQLMSHADRIGGYDILGVLGHGAHSTIFAAQDPRTDQIYALKQVIRRSSEDQRFLQQAINEYQIASRFSHPALRQYYKMKRYRRFVTVSEVLLLMEMVDGRNLVQQRPSSLFELVKVFKVVAEAVSEIHRAGFVHADLKPNNMLITEKGEVKVIDFGQSCPMDTIKSRIQGTPDYIAPEQVKRRPLTARTDVFNFGATMYWCVTDHHVPTMIPNNDFQVGLRDAKPKLKAPIEYNPELPLAMNNLILNCLRTRPSNRPADMTEVHARLQVVAAKLDREQPTRQVQHVDYDEDEDDGFEL
ncbi:MAG: serine/threonine-protein kinase [Phycisphaeraceae bacterium]